jgi:drug/metabolite transporter (DMT)-like permease
MLTQNDKTLRANERVTAPKELRTAKMYMFIAALLWGLGYVVQTLAMDYLGLFTFNGTRFGIGGSLLVLVALGQRKITNGSAEKGKIPIHAELANNLVPGLVCGVVLFLAMTSMQFALMITGSASRVGFISSSYILLAPGLALLLRSLPIKGKFISHLNELKTKRSEWIGLAFAGISILFISVPWNAVGDLNSGDLGTSIVLLTGAACLAAHILFYDYFIKVKKDKINVLWFTAIQFLLCALLSTTFAFLLEREHVISFVNGSLQSNGYMLVIISAIFPVCLAYVLQFLSQRIISLSTTVIACSAEPGFALVGDLGWNVLFVGMVASDIIGQWMLPGVIFVLFGFMLISKDNRIAAWIDGKGDRDFATKTEQKSKRLVLRKLQYILGFLP